MGLTRACACARQLGVGGAGAALGMRRTLAAILGSRLGSKALLAGATPRVRRLSHMYDEANGPPPHGCLCSCMHAIALDAAAGCTLCPGAPNPMLTLWACAHAGHKAHAADGAGVDAV